LLAAETLLTFNPNSQIVVKVKNPICRLSGLLEGPGYEPSIDFQSFFVYLDLFLDGHLGPNAVTEF
jgi:hypothetical protein